MPTDDQGRNMQAKYRSSRHLGLRTETGGFRFASVSEIPNRGEGHYRNIRQWVVTFRGEISLKALPHKGFGPMTSKMEITGRVVP